MTPLDLAVGEFGLSDKIQPYEHIQGRLHALRKAYAVHPEIAREVISYAWPHAQNRPWTHEEIHERLGLQPQQVTSEKLSEQPTEETTQRQGLFTSMAKPAIGAAAVLALSGGLYGGLSRGWQGYNFYRKYPPDGPGSAVISSMWPDILDEVKRGVRLGVIDGAGTGGALGAAYGAGKHKSGNTTGVEEKIAAIYLKSAAAQFVQQYFPAFGAAFDAFEATRAQQEAMDADRQRASYPAMHFTQPLMASYASGEAPPTHHRHRHHSG